MLRLLLNCIGNIANNRVGTCIRPVQPASGGAEFSHWAIVILENRDRPQLRYYGFSNVACAGKVPVARVSNPAFFSNSILSYIDAGRIPSPHFSESPSKPKAVLSDNKP